MQVIDGKLVAKLTREDIAKQVAALPQDTLGKIGLAVILVGDDPASQVYVRNKINGCAEVGITSTLVKMPADSTQEEVAEKIEALNADPAVSGILLQLPVPKHLDEAALLHLIDPAKDVDGCHYVQKGKLWTGEPELIPCTPYGVIKLLDHYSIPIEGRNAVVVGRSNLVGKPLAQLLLDRNATVTICHSRTKDLGAVTSRADIRSRHRRGHGPRRERQALRRRGLRRSRTQVLLHHPRPRRRRTHDGDHAAAKHRQGVPPAKGAGQMRMRDFPQSKI